VGGTLARWYNGRVSDPDSEILLEMTRIGGAVEVRAVSASDGLEVAFVATASTPKSDIEALARSKLAYVRGKAQGGATPKKPPGRPDGRGGVMA
jgi:hypothetical protein